MAKTPKNKAAVEESFKAMNAAMKAKGPVTPRAQKHQAAPTTLDSGTSYIVPAKFETDCLKLVLRLNAYTKP